MLLDDKRRADEYSGCNRQDETDNLVRAWTGSSIAAHATSAGIQLGGGMEDVGCCVHGLVGSQRVLPSASAPATRPGGVIDFEAGLPRKHG